MSGHTPLRDSDYGWGGGGVGCCFISYWQEQTGLLASQPRPAHTLC